MYIHYHAGERDPIVECAHNHVENLEIVTKHVPTQTVCQIALLVRNQLSVYTHGHPPAQCVVGSPIMEEEDRILGIAGHRT